MRHAYWSAKLRGKWKGRGANVGVAFNSESSSRVGQKLRVLAVDYKINLFNKVEKLKKNITLLISSRQTCLFIQNFLGMLLSGVIDGGDKCRC